MMKALSHYIQHPLRKTIVGTIEDVMPVAISPEKKERNFVNPVFKGRYLVIACCIHDSAQLVKPIVRIRILRCRHPLRQILFGAHETYPFEITDRFLIITV
jgi:hypothetical protein